MSLTSTCVPDEQLFRPVRAARVLFFGFTEELGQFLITLPLSISNVPVYRFSSLKQVVCNADQIVGDVSGSCFALTAISSFGGHNYPLENCLVMSARVCGTPSDEKVVQFERHIRFFSRGAFGNYNYRGGNVCT